MKLLSTLAILCLVAVNAFGIISVGEKVPDKCWTTSTGSEFCLNDEPGTIRVLLFNAGWCPPCNAEFRELVPGVGEFDSKPVTFISLSAQGWSHGATPNKQFLNEWKDRYDIPFTVAASPNDFGKDFQRQVFIPNVAIIDGDNTLQYAEVAPGTSAIFAKVRELLH